MKARFMTDWLLGGLVAAMIVTGCSSSDSPALYPVLGKVTLKGQPVEGASLVFVPSTPGRGEAATAITNGSGEYHVTTYTAGDGARPGKYNVKLFKYEDEGGEVRSVSFEDEQRIYPERVPAAAVQSGPKNILPKKYESETESGLVHTVTDGPTTFDITIE